MKFAGSIGQVTHSLTSTTRLISLPCLPRPHDPSACVPCASLANSVLFFENYVRPTNSTHPCVLNTVDVREITTVFTPLIPHYEFDSKHIGVAGETEKSRHAHVSFYRNSFNPTIGCLPRSQPSVMKSLQLFLSRLVLCHCHCIFRTSCSQRLVRVGAR